MGTRHDPHARAGRREPWHRGDPGADRPPGGPGVRRPSPAARPDPGGDRQRQGSGGPGAPPGGPPLRRALRRRQLRGDSRDPARGGDVRIRAGRLHGCPPGEEGALPDRPPGHAVPGRDRAPARWPAGQAAHGAGGAHRPAPRRDPERAGGRLDHHRDQPRPPGGDASGPIPRGSLPSARGPDPHVAAPAGAAARRRAPRGALPGASVRRLRARRRRRWRPTPGRRSSPTGGRATSASSSTSWSA